MPMEVRQAVRKAFEHAKLLLDDSTLERNLALEEVDFDEDKGHWLITIGYDALTPVTKTTGPDLFPTTESEIRREYKVLRMDAHDGRLINMKIRDVSTPQA